MKADRLEDVPLVRINAPEIFRDPAFKEWFFHRKGPAIDGKQYEAPVIATWHRMSEPEFGEYSDFFMFVDFLGGEDLVGDGSESDMPDHIWRMLINATWLALGKPKWHVETMIWVSNLGDGDLPSPEWHMQTLVDELLGAGFEIRHKEVLPQLLDRCEIHIEAINLGPDDLLKFAQMGLKVLSPSMQGKTACWCLQFDGPRRLLRRNFKPVVTEVPEDGPAKSDA